MPLRPLALASLVLAISPCAFSAEPSSPDPRQQEANRRNDAMVEAGFNLTHGFRFAADSPPVRLELVLPGKEERSLRFWVGVQDGSAEVRFTGPGGAVIAQLSAPTGEFALTRELPAGSYLLQIDHPASAGAAVFGVKGSAVEACALDGARVTEVPAAPSSGFHSPYLLYVPEKVTHGNLLVVPNNTGFLTEDLALLRASAACQLAHEVPLASRLGTPMLVPLFPRPHGSAPGDADAVYLHALTREALTTTVPAWKRVDLQLLAMVKDARARLASRGMKAKGRLLLTGFSASGSFVNRFAMLHPEEVLAVVSGSPGGWPLAPVARVGREVLPYPVGLGGVDALTGRAPDLTALRKVRWFFFLGDHDENDAVPHRDSFSQQDEELIFRRFGKTPVARWKDAERLYAAQKLDARFRLYPGVAHDITPEIREDIARFFEQSLATVRQ